MKYIKRINIFVLLALLTGCTTATLNDFTANTFMITVSQGNEDNIKSEWNALNFYQCYTVFRSSSENGLYEPVAERIKSTSFTDKNIVAAQIYFYKVQGFNDMGYGMYTTDPVSGFAGIVGGLGAPINLSDNSGESDSSLTLSWGRVNDATSYNIYELDDNDFPTKIGDTVSLSYKINNLEAGGVYRYVIRSVGTLTLDDGSILPIESDNSEIIEGHTFGGDLKQYTEPGAYSNKIVITWEHLSVVESYEVYKSQNINSMGNIVKTISSSGLTDGETVEYTDTDVRAGNCIIIQ